MIIREYDVYLNENTKQTEEILLKVVDLFEGTVVDNEQLFESDKISGLGSKMSNFFGGILKGVNIGKKMGDIFKDWKKAGSPKSLKKMKDYICSPGDIANREVEQSSDNNNIMSPDDFERLISIMSEIFQEMDEDFKSQFRPQLEELFDLLGKYAKENKIKFMSKSVFNRVMRF